MEKTIYFYSPGACSLGGQIVLEWIGQPYWLCRVEREVRAGEKYKRINPQAKVPAIKKGEQVIVENAAILTHLARHAPQLKLMPETNKPQYDELNEWLSYLSSGFHVAFYPYFMPGRYIEDVASHPAVKEMALQQIRKQMQFVDQHLQNQQYFLGEQKTILDPYFYAMSRWGKMLLKDIANEFPNIARHQAIVEADPATQFALSTERGETAKSPSGACQGNIDLEKV